MNHRTRNDPRPDGAGVEWWIGWGWRLAIIGLVLANARAWTLAWSSTFALPTHPGFDFFETYLPAVERWLSGGSFYHPHQLSGPYEVWFQAADPILYPPTILPLLAAFTVLPAALWWIVPLGIIAACAVALRPRWEAVAAAGLLAVWPGSLAYLAWFGNPTMWMVAALAVAVTGRTWAAPLVLVKPSIFPFALYGIRSRGWWVGLAVLGAVSLAFLPLWLEYATALLNARGAGILYSLWNAPAMAVPLALWAGQTKRRTTAAEAT